MKAEGKTDSDHGKFEYFIQKPSSFYSPSLKNVKSLGLASLNVSGVLFKEESNESSYTSGNVRYTSITSTTWQFPELDDAFWETLLEKLYSSIQEKFSTNYAISFIDVDKITSHPEYANFWEPNEANTDIKIEKNYKNTKRMQAASIREVFSSASTTFSRDLPEYKLMRDNDVDGLLMVTLDLRVSDANKKKIVLDPVLSFKVLSGAVSYGLAPIGVIMEGTVSGRGIPFKMKEFNSLDGLVRIAQIDNLLYGMTKSIADIQVLEEEEKYFETWQLFNE